MKNQQGKKQHGFTLMELMIVVAIIAIISAIAIPAYQDYTIRSKIPQATSILANMRVRMEQYYQDNRTYLNAPCSDSNDYFTFSCPTSPPNPNPNGIVYPNPNPNDTTYTIEAKGQGAMAGFYFTIDESNKKTSTINSPAPSGWVANQNNCWITNKGGAC